MAPENTDEPGAFGIRNGSPVRYDSSITPWPSSTTPSTGQISCGKITMRSSTRTASSAMSSTCPSMRRCAADGMRLASACSTDEARPTA